MLDKLSGKALHAHLHFIACLGIVAGLPWSKVPLSLATALLVINFLLSGRYSQAWKIWKENVFLRFFTVYLLVEISSLFWTANFQYAANDLLVKLPFFVIPYIIVAFPFENIKKLYWIALVFLAACFVTSFINVGSYLHWWGNRTYDDFRGLSLFVSHVRYALFIVFAMVLCTSWVLQKLPYKWIAVALFLWFGWYTYFAQIIAGYVAIAGSALIGGLLLIQLFRSKTIRISLYFSILAASIAGLFWIVGLLQPVERKVNPKDLPKTTVNGRPYFNEITYQNWENGYPLGGSLCEEELIPAWNAKSKLDYEEGRDLSGNRLKHSLWRYMTSKGLTKDSLGFTKMTNEDVSNIENGVSSILQLNGGFKSRIYSIQQELQYNQDPNGHSLLERLEYWKTAFHIIEKHWIVGVGLGDVEDSFNKEYINSHSKLLPENRHRAHNQFLTTMITSGIIGLLCFLLWWFSQLWSSWKTRNFEWCCFVVIVLGSFLTEDTLETQSGGVFVAFFFALFAGGVARTAHNLSFRTKKTKTFTEK